MKKNILILFLFLSTTILGQSEKEDLINLDLIKHYKGINNDSLLIFSKKLQKSKDSCLIYSGKISQTLALYQKNNYDGAEKLAKIIVNELVSGSKFCLLKVKIEALNRLFWIKKNQNKFNDAFNYLIQTKELINTIPLNSNYYNTISLSVQINTALIKSLLGHNEESRKILFGTLNKYYLRNTSIDERHDYYSKILNQTSIYNIIGETYLNASKKNTSSYLDSARVYFKKAYKVAQKFTPPHKNSETLYQLREAEVLIAKKKFKEALTLINKYSTNSEEYKTTQNINSLKAICFYQLKNKDSALYFGKQFLTNHHKKPNSRKRLAPIYDILTNQYYLNQQIDSAYKYSELTIAEINSLNKSKNEVNKAHYLYDYNNALKLNNLIVKKEKENKNILLIIIIFIVLAGVLIVYFLLKKNKKTINYYIKNNNLKLIKKKEYNIDKELENSILKGINDLEKSTDYLDASFTINVLAKKLNTNTSYLSYIINKVKNQSFKQYITALKINYLLKKLQQEKKFRNYTIKSLAEEIGYTNASAFTRAFKIYKGITPSEFIKSLK